MNCFDEGQLRDYLDGDDGALSVTERSAIATHLTRCPACAEQLQTLRVAKSVTGVALRPWLPGAPATSTVPVSEQQLQAALTRFADRQRRESTPASAGVLEMIIIMLNRLRGPRLRPALIVAALAVVVVVALVFAPLDSLAMQINKTFRAQQFAVITVRVPKMQTLPQPQAAGSIDWNQVQQMLAPLGTPTTNATKTTVREAANQQAARDFLKGYGTQLKAPAKMPAAFAGQQARYAIADPTSSTYVLNVPVARQYLAMLNKPELNNLPWPAGVDTLTFGLDTPAAAVTIYGDKTQGFAIVQMANLDPKTPGAGPILHLPDELDVNAFRAALLALPGLPQDTVDQVKNVKHWERTLILPVPENAQTENVSIGGDPGVVIVDGEGRGVLLLWQSNGIFYAVGGTISKADALAVANSLKTVP